MNSKNWKPIDQSVYNDRYNYWRGIQRDQLGFSANLYMIIASAILGYTIDFLVEKKDGIVPCSKTLLILSVLLLVISLVFHTFFTHNRLKDFRTTAKLILKDLTDKEIREETKDLGELTWNLYKLQRLMLYLGFIFSFFGFFFLICS